MELENIAILEEIIKQDKILSHPDIEGKQILVSPSFLNKFIDIFSVFVSLALALSIVAIKTLNGSLVFSCMEVDKGF